MATHWVLLVVVAAAGAREDLNQGYMPYHEAEAVQAETPPTQGM